ncbi:FixH family protein [Phenylobacterium sp.]|uniref:FixH family protein n=1 Tax=Phenylobacterium sp. TaxID=1871053 RepID=UPI002FCBC467
MNPAPPAAGFRVTGWHVLIVVVAFFGIVIAVDGIFVIKAYRTFPGQVSATPYEDGLRHNRSVARLKAQSALGWRALAAPAQGQVEVEIVDQTGRPIRGLALSGELQRPATEAGRIVLTFTEVSPGRYAAAATPAPGVWDLRFAATGAQPFEAERRLTWP